MSKEDMSAVARLSAADPASSVTEDEVARSRARSLAVMDTDVTHIAVGGSIDDFHIQPAKRHWGRLAGLGLAAAAAAAVVVGVVVASTIPTVPIKPAAPATSQTSPVQETPSGPLSDLFASADEVLVLQALPNRAVWNKAWEESLAKSQSAASSPGGLGPEFPSLGVEPVNILQVLKGSRSAGQATLDVEAAPDWWRNTNNVAPLTFLAFVAKGPDGGMHLMKEPQALLEIQNLRQGTLTDPTTHENVDVGGDLRQRISVAPAGDVPIATYASASSQPDVIQETRKKPDGTAEGIMHGRVTATEACFTFQTSTEKVYLRWPAGYTAAIKSLPQDADGNFALEGTSRGDRPVVLNDWGIVYAYDRSSWPLIAGSRTNETASCNNESLPVFEVTPPSAGTSPFALDHESGVALP